jgi:transposase
MVGLERKCESLEKEIASLRAENETLRAIVKAFSGPVPEQKLDDARQMQLAEIVAPAEEAPAAGREAESAEPPPAIFRKGGRKRRVPLAEKIDRLPVSKITYVVPDVVKGREDQYREIEGEECVEVIYHKASVSLHKIVRRKFAPKQGAPVVGKSPPRFSSSFVSASLAIAVVLDKYSFHGTLYRMERKFREMGLDLSRKTQSDIVERFSMWVRPLYEFIKRRALESRYLQIDETFIKYINGRLSGSSTGYFWAINAPGEATVLEWFSNRRHENAETVLYNWIPDGDPRGRQLQSDGYEAYSGFAAGREEVELLACWAHAFRKLRDALAADRELVLPAMKLIGRLYELEESWDRQGLGERERKLAREAESLPLAAEIRRELEAIASDLTILPSSDARKAAAYALKRWEALAACLRHGHTSLDTNSLERQFRDSAIGKKNWMFVGHPQAGQKSAAIYTLLACCKTHRINPERYFSGVLDRLVAADGKPSDELLESLLPKVWIASNPEALVKEPARA